ncbi:hypothetical protein B9Z55_025418 [Caenorhabditis nigoni]|nr:hypothetical protein B9Z55_025418 [Caenorhabditis nigoni]
MTIRLVGGEEDKFFRRIVLDSQIKLDELMKEIQSVTIIPPEFQQIEFRSEELPDNLHPLESINDFENIVVKHSHLCHWNAYLNHVKKFNEAQEDETKQNSAESAQRLYNKLSGSSFFIVYPYFDIAVTKHHKPISKYLDKHARWIEDAVKNFFALSMFNRQNPEIEFEETISEKLPAVICKITVNSITHKYKITALNNAGKISQASRWDDDLIELYCYKLLESIGVGPRIVIIPHCVASELILYIGSEWLSDFQSFNSTEQATTTEITHAVVQMHLLAVILSLCDIHEENSGLNANSDPIILDFIMSNYRDPKNRFLYDNNIICSIRARDVLLNCDSTTRLQIAKDAIRKWNLMDKLGKVLELMDKEDFCRKMSDFDKKKQDLDQFVENVRSNIVEFSRD